MTPIHALWLAAAGAAGTLAVNVLGSFAFGAIFALTRSRGLLSTAQETILLVGLLGGFTTYSSFAFQSVEMLEAGRALSALAYIVGTNAAALAAVWAGLRLFSA
jgi:CrcB protein